MSRTRSLRHCTTGIPNACLGLSLQTGCRSTPSFHRLSEDVVNTVAVTAIIGETHMADSLDLDAYLERIRWDGVGDASLDTLTTLLDAHMSRIPFENLDVLLGRPVRLDLKGLQAKLVQAGRGGYCFEHATLFAAVLEAFGFRPARHSARVTLYEPRTVSSRTHMFLTVPIDQERFVVDPGFGMLAPRLPIRLVDDARARRDNSHWMVRDADYWLLRAKRGEKVIDAWASTM